MITTVTDKVSASINAKTRFSNKMGVYSPEDKTITWTADNGIQIVSYLSGRGYTLTYPQHEKGNYLNVMIALAKNAFEQRSESVFSQTLVRGTWPLNKTFHWHIIFDPRLTPIVTSFTRHPEPDDTTNGELEHTLQIDVSTPYSCVLSKEMVQKLGLFLSSFSLPPEAYAVLHKSISDYFGACHGYYKDWAMLADEKFFKSWSKSDDFIEGHASFSSLTWATVSKFVLGVPEEDFADYAHIWNTLLQSTKGVAKQLFTKMWYYPEMEMYVLKKIRETTVTFLEDPNADISEYCPETIIHYWLRNNTADAILEKLPSSMREQALIVAENRELTIEEMVYLDNFFVVMIGMQENIAFILTQITYLFAHNPSLLQRCESNRDTCKKMVWEVLRFMPPAGTSRELRWDADVIDPITGKIYSANKGDQFITMPAVTMHLDAFSPPEHDSFNIDRPRTHSNAFSEGPHSCPGQTPALNWLYELTHMLAQYDFSREGLEDPEYYNSFILRDGDMKFKMCGKEAL